MQKHGNIISWSTYSKTSSSISAQLTSSAHQFVAILTKSAFNEYEYFLFVWTSVNLNMNTKINSNNENSAKPIFLPEWNHVIVSYIEYLISHTLSQIL